MKKLLLSLAAIALLCGNAAATTTSMASQTESKTAETRSNEAVIMELQQTPSQEKSETELYYDHVELEAPIIDTQVEAEIDSL